MDLQLYYAWYQSNMELLAYKNYTERILLQLDKQHWDSLMEILLARVYRMLSPYQINPSVEFMETGMKWTAGMEHHLINLAKAGLGQLIQPTSEFRPDSMVYVLKMKTVEQIKVFLGNSFKYNC